MRHYAAHAPARGASRPQPLQFDAMHCDARRACGCSPRGGYRPILAASGCVHGRVGLRCAGPPEWVVGAVLLAPGRGLTAGGAHNFDSLVLRTCSATVAELVGLCEAAHAVSADAQARGRGA